MGYREALERETAIMDLFRFPTRIDAFGVVFCSKGSATVTADLKHCVIGGQTMFVCPPGTIIQVESQQQAAVRFILCEEDFINRIRIDLKLLLHLFMAVRETYTDARRPGVGGAHAIARRNLCRRPSGPHRRPLRGDSVVDVPDAGLPHLPDHRQPHRKARDGSRTDNASLNRNAAYFNTFLEELSKHYLQERSVGFYAEQLHLTPKYLTTLLRSTTGRTASEWIDEYVILEAKNLLKYSTMNIQEIAYYLNFPNQSFFGRYFKQHTGMTPRPTAAANDGSRRHTAFIPSLQPKGTLPTGGTRTGFQADGIPVTDACKRTIGMERRRGLKHIK